MKPKMKQQITHFLISFVATLVLLVGVQVGSATNGNILGLSGRFYHHISLKPFLSSDNSLPTKIGSLILKDFGGGTHSFLLGNSTYRNRCISHKEGAEKETCLEVTKSDGLGYGFFNLLSALDNNSQQMVTVANGSASSGGVVVEPFTLNSSSSSRLAHADFIEEQFSDGNDSMLISSLALKGTNGDFAPSDPNRLRPVCADSQGMLTTDCGTTATYTCSGSITNGQMCSGDDQNLTQNGTWHAVENCGADKCEYTCDTGYHEDNGSCVADATYHWETGDWGNCESTGMCQGTLSGHCAGSGYRYYYDYVCYNHDCQCVERRTYCSGLESGNCNFHVSGSITLRLLSPFVKRAYAAAENNGRDGNGCLLPGAYGACHWVNADCSIKNGTSESECESYNSACSWSPGDTVRTRDVWCEDQNGTPVADSNCDANTRPQETESCSTGITLKCFTGIWEENDSLHSGGGSVDYVLHGNQEHVDHLWSGHKYRITYDNNTTLTTTGVYEVRCGHNCNLYIEDACGVGTHCCGNGSCAPDGVNCTV